METQGIKTLQKLCKFEWNLDEEFVKSNYQRFEHIALDNFFKGVPHEEEELTIGDIKYFIGEIFLY
jgi:hypothetical protein